MNTAPSPAPNQYPCPMYYQEEPLKYFRRSLRKDSNRLSFGVLVTTAFMVLIFLFLLFLLKFLGYPFTGGRLTSGLDEQMYYLISGLYYLLAAFIPFLFILVVSKQNVNEAIPVKKVKPSIFILSILFGSGVCLAANFPTNAVANFLESIGLNAQMPESFTPQTLNGIIVYYIFIAIIPPFVEEFAFRGIILSRFRKYGNGFAVFASSILFALFHGNVIQFIFAFICGLVFGFITIKTENLFIPIIIHIINNGFSVTVELLYEYCYEDFANGISFILLISMLALGLISLILLISKNRDFFRSAGESNVSQLSVGSRIWNFTFNPGFVAMLIYYAFLSAQFLKI